MPAPVIPLLALGAAYYALREAPPEEERPAITVPEPGDMGMTIGGIDWTPLLEEHRGSLPRDFLERWITKESGGNPCSIGVWGGPWEAGIGQAYYERPGQRVYGVTLDELRGMCNASGALQQVARQPTDDELRAHVVQLVGMANDYVLKAARYLDAAGESWEGDDVLCLAKLYHALPVLVIKHLAQSSKTGSAYSWDAFRAHIISLSGDELGAPANRYMPLDRLFENAQYTGKGY